MTKRRIAVVFSLLVSLMCTSMMTGCSNESEKADAENTADKSSSSTDEGADGEKTVVTMSMWDAINEEYNFVEEFNNSQDEIELQIISIPENYSEKLNAMIVSDTAPDIILSWECDILRFIQDDVVIPLDEYVENSDLADEQMVPAVQKFSDMTGGTYSLPWCYAGECLFYNKDMFDEAGIEYPTEDWTMEDFKNAAEALSVKEGDETVQYGIDAFEGATPWYSFIGSYGDEIVDADANLVIGDGTREALAFFKDLTDNGYMAKPSTATENSGTADLFAAGKAAMKATGTWNASVYRDIDSFHWDIAPLPHAEKAYNSIHTGLFTITKSCEHPDAAWEVINFLMGDKGQELIGKAYGNMSARPSITEKGYFKVSGEMGPTNMDAYDTISETVEIGYVLLNSGLQGDVAQKFNAVMLDQLSIDDCMEQCEQLNREINS